MRPSETHEGARGRQETEWCIRAGCAPGRHGLRGREEEHDVDQSTRELSSSRTANRGGTVPCTDPTLLGTCTALYSTRILTHPRSVQGWNFLPVLKNDLLPPLLLAQQRYIRQAPYKTALDCEICSRYVLPLRIRKSL